MPGETSTGDNNSILVLRARGTVRGEQKLIELAIRGISAFNLVNCLQDAVNEQCPEVSGVGGSITLDSFDGEHNNGFLPTPLQPDFPLDNANNYYRQPGNYPWITDPTHIHILSGAITLTVTPNPHKPEEVKMEDNSFYFTDGKITVKDTKTTTGNSGVTVFSLNDVDVETATQLFNTVVVGVGTISLHGGAELHALLPYPVIIAGDTVDFGSSSVTVTGNVYAVNAISTNPITINGLLIADNIDLQGNTTISDQENLDYYTPMPGFIYPPELLTTVSAGSSAWKEIE